MKAHPSCVQDLHSLFVRARATGFDIDTITPKSRRGRKRTRRLPTAYFATSGLASARRAIVSKCTGTLFPFCCSSYLCKPKLLNRGIRRSFSCSPNDGDRVEAKLQGGSDENSVPLTYADSNLEEEVERFDCGEAKSESESELVSVSDEDGFRIQIVKLGKRSRRVESSILINASLSTIWEVLTDYERLADFIPGLAVSRLLDKRDKYARLFQYHAEMVEAAQAFDILEGQELQSTLFYEVELEPKLWLPVRLVEGRICKEIKTNLSSIRQEAQIRLASSS